MPSLLSPVVNTVKGVVKGAIKRPGLLAAGGGAAVVYNQAGNKAKALEKEIMRNRVGAPGAKYVYASLEKFAEHKRALCERVVLAKVAADPRGNLVDIGILDHLKDAPNLAAGNIGEALGKGIGKTLGEAGATGITGLVQAGARKVKDKLILEPKRQKALKEITEGDPVVSAYEAETPGASEQAFSSMRRVAPELSTDPNVVRSYLREAAQTGGTTNYLTLKQLAEAEDAINRAVRR